MVICSRKQYFPVLSFLREKRFHHLEALGDPVAVPGVHALFVELVRLADVICARAGC